MRTRPVTKVLVGLFLLVVGLFLTMPVVAVVAQSFTSTDYVGFPPSGFSTRWYEEAFGSDSPFRSSFLLSLQISTGVAVVAGILGTLSAYATVRYRFFGRTLLRAFVMSPLTLPGLLIGISIFSVLMTLQLPVSPLAIMIGQSALTLPFVFQLVSSQLVGLDPNLDRAARSLGAGPVRTFVAVTLPLTRLGLVSGLVFAFLLSFDDAVVALFLTAPGVTTLPVQLLAHSSVEYSPVIMAAGSILVLISAVGLLILERTVGIARLFGLD